MALYEKWNRRSFSRLIINGNCYLSKEHFDIRNIPYSKINQNPKMVYVLSQNKWIVRMGLSKSLFLSSKMVGRKNSQKIIIHDS